MLAESADLNVITRFPWTLAPAVAIFIVVLAANVMIARQSPDVSAR